MKHLILEGLAMKNFTLSLFLFSAMFSAIIANASDLKLTMGGNSDFYMVVDGTEYNSVSGEAIARNIRGGNVYLEVFTGARLLNNDYSWNRSFSGYVNLMPGRFIIATIDRYGAFKVLSSEAIAPQWSDPYGGYGSNGGYAGYGHGNSYGNGYNGNHHGNGYACYNTSPSYNTGYYAPMGMSPQAFSVLMATVRREAFDDNKLRIASGAIMMNGVSTAQLRDLMLLLSFDDNRLALARTAYPYVIDKGNIFMINDAFTFSSTAEDFYSAIGW